MGSLAFARASHPSAVGFWPSSQSRCVGSCYRFILKHVIVNIVMVGLSYPCKGPAKLRLSIVANLHLRESRARSFHHFSPTASVSFDLVAISIPLSPALSSVYGDQWVTKQQNTVETVQRRSRDFVDYLAGGFPSIQHRSSSTAALKTDGAGGRTSLLSPIPFPPFI